MAEITYSSVIWTTGDVITEAKLDSMTANDQAVDAHALGFKFTNRADPADADVGSGKGFIYSKSKNSVATPYFKNGDNNTAKELLQMPASVAQGDVLYIDSTGNVARLGAGTSGQFLKTQGAGANPTWASAVSTKTRSFYVPSRAMENSGTTGGATLVRTSANDIGSFLLLDASLTEGAGFNIVLPIDWSSGNLTAYVYYSLVTSVSGAVVFRLKRGNFADEGEDVDTAAADIDFTDTIGTALANYLQISAGQTIPTTGASAGAIMSLGIFRIGGSGSDTYTGDIRLHGIRFDYTSVQ